MIIIKNKQDRAVIYNNILETIGNTPVVKINRLAPSGIDMYVKVEAFNPMASVKDRLAIGIIEDAERKGLLKPGQTVVEATSGNTGIALAMVCAVKGYPFVAVMAESFSIERRKLMRALGARVVLTPAAERATGMLRVTKALSEKHGWFMTEQFDNQANPEYHRNTTGPEIIRDFVGRRLDYYVSGWGTGGTITGVSNIDSVKRVLARSRSMSRSSVPTSASGKFRFTAHTASRTWPTRARTTRPKCSAAGCSSSGQKPLTGARSATP